MSTTVSKTAKCYIPKGYKAALDPYDTQRAIEYIKNNFQNELCTALNLKRVSAPLFVKSNSGLNDDLTGRERAVTFDVPAIGDDAVVVAVRTKRLLELLLFVLRS